MKYRDPYTSFESFSDRIFSTSSRDVLLMYFSNRRERFSLSHNVQKIFQSPIMRREIEKQEAIEGLFVPTTIEMISNVIFCSLERGKGRLEIVHECTSCM